MAENSNIEWTDHTFNPWIGCTKVSQGCKHCYAEELMTRKPRWADTWGPEGDRVRTSDAYWRKPLSWNRQAEAEGRRYRVFCASLADVFEERAELEPWRRELFNLIDQTPHLDWLLLTKRPAQVSGTVPVRWWDEMPANVWIGTSVEDQETADQRIPELLRVPARVRFLSCEPLLGPVDLRNPHYGLFPEGQIPSSAIDYHLAMGGSEPDEPDGIRRAEPHSINWVIVGGESGPNARPMHPDWARDLRDQCVAAGVPFLFKQWGAWLPSGSTLYDGKFVYTDGVALDDYKIRHGVDMCHMRRVGKKAAGRLLDGREWHQFPEGVPA